MDGWSGRADCRADHTAGEASHRGEGPLARSADVGVDAEGRIGVPTPADEELASLADAAKAAAERAAEAIDDALEFIDASNRRIASIERHGRRTMARSKS